MNGELGLMLRGAINKYWRDWRLKLDLKTSQLFPSKPRKNNPTKTDFLEVYSEVFYSQFSDAELLRNADYYQELAFRLTGKTKLS